MITTLIYHYFYGRYVQPKKVEVTNELTDVDLSNFTYHALVDVSKVNIEHGVVNSDIAYSSSTFVINCFNSITTITVSYE